MGALILEERKERMSDLFRKIDKNGDGVLSRAEVRAALKDLGINASRDDFSDLMVIIDLDGGGDISMKELAKAITRAMRGELDTLESRPPISKKPSLEKKTSKDKTGAKANNEKENED